MKMKYFLIRHFPQTRILISFLIDYSNGLQPNRMFFTRLTDFGSKLNLQRDRLVVAVRFKILRLQIQVIKSSYAV